MTRDTSDAEVETRIASIATERRRRGVWTLVVAVILALLTVGVYVAVQFADTARDAATESRSVVVAQDIRLQNLEKALQAQRTQFTLCKGRASNTIGCEEPITPEPGDIGPQGIQGLQGIQGVRGRPGSNGSNGTNGRDGADGQSITGPAGADGADGEPGPAGPQGEPGESIVGPQGERGAVGPAGPDGTSAYPFSFVFTVPQPTGDITYTVACQIAGCTVSQS